MIKLFNDNRWECNKTLIPDFLDTRQLLIICEMRYTGILLLTIASLWGIQAERVVATPVKALGASPAAAVIGQQITASYLLTGKISYFLVNMGDDPTNVKEYPDLPTDTVRLRHYYAKPGNYWIRLMAYDSISHVIGSDSILIKISSASIVSPIVGVWNEFKFVDLGGVSYHEFADTIQFFAEGRYRIGGGWLDQNYFPTGAFTINGQAASLVPDSPTVSLVSTSANRIAVYMQGNDTLSHSDPMSGTYFFTRALSLVALRNRDEDFTVYPTPSNRNLVIGLGLLQAQGELLVYDELGRVVFIKRLSGESEVPISNLVAGTYTVEVRSLTSTKRVRAMIVR